MRSLHDSYHSEPAAGQGTQPAGQPFPYLPPTMFPQQDLDTLEVEELRTGVLKSHSSS